MRYKHITFLVLVVFFLAGCATVPTKVVEKKGPPTFGFRMRDLTPKLAQDLSLSPETKGVLVIGVFKGLPAEAAGLQEGDVVLKVNDQVFTETKALDDALRTYIKTSTPVVLEVLRQGETLNISPGEAVKWTGQPLVQPPPNPTPRTLKLAADGSGDFRTIMGALLASRPGDTILIAPGDYPGFEVNRDDLTIVGEARNKVTVEGINISGKKGLKIKSLTVNASKERSAIVIINATGLLVEDCVILNGKHGLWLHNVEGVITGCIIKENVIVGIAVQPRCQVKISRNLIEGNGRMGIEIDSSRADIESNTIVNQNKGEVHWRHFSGIGVLLLENANVSLYNNIIAYNHSGIFMNADRNNVWRIEHNDIYGNRVGNVNWDTAVMMIKKDGKIVPWKRLGLSNTNVCVDPIFVDLFNKDFRLRAGSPLVDKGLGGTYIGAFPPVGQEVGEGEFK